MPTITPNLPPVLDEVAPVIDDDLLIRFRGRWVAATDMQAPVVAHLLDNLGEMVSIDEVRAAYTSAGGSDDLDAIRSLMHRIGRKLTAVGASVTYARHRAGMMVSVATGPSVAMS